MYVYNFDKRIIYVYIVFFLYLKWNPKNICGQW